MKRNEYCSFTILSFNVFSGPFSTSQENRLRYLGQLEKIKNVSPDIVCLQEFNTDEIETIYLPYMSHLDYDYYLEKDDDRHFIETKLFFLLYQLLSCIPHHGFRRFLFGKQKHGICTFWKKNTFYLLSSNSITFKNKGYDLLTYLRPRGFSHLSLIKKHENYSFSLINTHMNLDNENTRYLQSKQIFHYLQETQRQHHSNRIVICGDFNTQNKNEQAIQLFLSHSFINACQDGITFLKNGFFTDWFGKLWTDKTCDFILLLGFLVKTIERIHPNEMYSDHFALFSSLEILDKK